MSTMDTPQTETPQTETPQNQPPSLDGLNHLQAQCDSLRNAVVWILVLLLIVSVTLTLYIWRLSKEQHQELEVVGPQVKGMLAQYEQHKQATDARRDKFIADLIQYGATHPDFVPILAKYGLTKYSPRPESSSFAPPPSSTVPMPLPAKK